VIAPVVTAMYNKASKIDGEIAQLERRRPVLSAALCFMKLAWLHLLLCSNWAGFRDGDDA